MGVVYEAEQRSPRRRVALKVVRASTFLDDTGVRLLEREADALARLRHPGIAAIYEFGRTGDGRPFFAMELVRGETLRDYLNRRRGPVTRAELAHRLGLFREICDAVHYAHQRGVIHRDLKPSNILVCAETAPRADADTPDGGGAIADSALRRSGSDAAHLPRIKILDFGLARISEGDGTEGSVLTEIGHIKGTLPYMSPEQARGESAAIDTRTDVYALGVVLYEMLAGERPYDVTGLGLVEAVRVICEDPPRSIRASWTGVRPLDPDVETILGKALEKDSDRRYDGAGALSEDVARYLTSQPILARPPSAIYQLRKFARRHRAIVAGVAATVVVLVAGVVVSTVFGVREAAQRRTAETARADLETVVEFQSEMLRGVRAEAMGERLVDDLRARVASAMRERGHSEDEIAGALAAHDRRLAGVNPTDVALTVLDENVLGSAAASIDEEFADRPAIRATLKTNLGDVYRELGLYERAEPLFRDALEIRRELFGEDHRATLRAVNNYGGILADLGRFDEAETFHVASLEGRRRVFGTDHPETVRAIQNMGWLYSVAGRPADAEPYFREALDLRRADPDTPPGDLVDAESNFANLLNNLGRIEEAEELLRGVLDRARRLGGPEDGRTLVVQHNLGRVLTLRGKFEEAERLLTDCLEIRRRTLGDDHPNVAATTDALAGAIASAGRHDAALPVYLEALARSRRVHGEGHPDTLRSMSSVGYTLGQLGRLDEAAPYYVEAYETSRRALGPDHVDSLRVARNYGWLLQVQGREPEALALFEDLSTRTRRVLGEAHPDTLLTEQFLGSSYRRLGRIDDAERVARAALAASRRALGESHPDTLYAAKVVLRILEDRENHEEAEALYAEYVEWSRGAYGGADRKTVRALRDHGQSLVAIGELDRAVARLTEARDTAKASLGDDHPETLATTNALAGAFSERGDQEQAEHLHRTALEGFRRSSPERRVSIGWTHVAIGRVLLRQSRSEQAEIAFREGLRILEEGNAASREQAEVVRERVARFYDEEGETVRASAWRTPD